jgi:hypothetical protein
VENYRFKSALSFTVSSIIGLWGACLPDVSFAQFSRQTIRNDTEQDVNDVRVTFDNQTREARLTTRTNPPPRVRGRLSSNLMEATFAQNTFGILASGGRVDIDFDRSRTLVIDNPATRITSSKWTKNGDDIVMAKVRRMKHAARAAWEASLQPARVVRRRRRETKLPLVEES